MRTSLPNDAAHGGRPLSRREALALMGASGAALLAGLTPAPGRAQATAGGGALPKCLARPQQTEGPFFVEAVHVHFKIRTAPASAQSLEFTSQLYFDDGLTERMFVTEPYASRGRRWMRNADDGIFRAGGKQLLLATEPDGQGYAATFDIALQG